MKPLIAVTTRYAAIKELPSLYVNQSYLSALTQAGADPVLLYPEQNEAYYQRLASFSDGLLITGGKDIDPGYYEEPAQSYTVTEPAEIDHMDFGAIRAFSDSGKPILGICRGAQAVNIFFGGSLYQHLPDQDGFSCNHKQTISRTLGSHRIIWNGTPKLWTPGIPLTVNSLHHQGIHRPAPGFHIAAKSEDGLIEAIEKNRILAVQWHPEEMTADPQQMQLFSYFVRQL